MNDYKIELPNGKSLNMNGSTPPTDADIDFQFKRLYPEDFEASSVTKSEKDVIKPSGEED